MKSLLSAFGMVEGNLNLETVREELLDFEGEKKGLLLDIEDQEKNIDEAELAASSMEVVELRNRLIESDRKIAKLEKNIEKLNFEYMEGEKFHNALQENILALRQSDIVVSEFGAVDFSFCPACFEPVGHSDGSVCHLCKAPVKEGEIASYRLRMLRELEMQSRESSEIQKDIRKDLEVEKGKIRAEKVLHQKTLLELQSAQTTAYRPLQDKQRKLYERLGWLERQIEILGQRLEIAEKISSLSDRKGELEKRVSELEDKITAAKVAQKRQRSRAYTLLSETTRDLLNNDLEREDNFQKAENVAFDFGKEVLTVDGESFFAASSQVYLKNSFLLAILLSSLKDEGFRFPRFLMLDGLEDKGMEIPRVQHFQRLLNDRSAASDVRHQIILTGETLDSSLNRPDIIVGRRYTHTNKALDL